MSKKTIKITNDSGLHARPAGMLVKAITELDADVRVLKGDRESNAKSMMGILSLGAKKGEELTFVAEGVDELRAIREVESLFASNFGE